MGHRGLVVWAQFDQHVETLRDVRRKTMPVTCEVVYLCIPDTPCNYGICAGIYIQNEPNVSKYTIHIYMEYLCMFTRVVKLFFMSLIIYLFVPLFDSSNFIWFYLFVRLSRYLSIDPSVWFVEIYWSIESSHAHFVDVNIVNGQTARSSRIVLISTMSRGNPGQPTIFQFSTRNLERLEQRVCIRLPWKLVQFPEFGRFFQPQHSDLDPAGAT